MTDFPVSSAAVAEPERPTRPLLWSVRRELWENRSVYFAPLAVSSLVQFGVLMSTLTLPRRMPRIQALDPVKQCEAISMGYNAIAGTLIMTAFLVSVFYCLDALHGERRDRSILFWKSLPVSDRTTVLAKAAIPLVVLPAVVFVIAIAGWILVFLLSNLLLLNNAPGLAVLWKNFKFFQSMISFLYGLICIALWHAPVYCWMLLVSAWAKRATFLWAVLPWLAVAATERITLGTRVFFDILGRRMTGWFTSGFTFVPKSSQVVLEPLQHLTPARFLAQPALWLGLVFAALFLAAAIRLRRHREPI